MCEDIQLRCRVVGCVVVLLPVSYHGSPRLVVSENRAKPPPSNPIISGLTILVRCFPRARGKEEIT